MCWQCKQAGRTTTVPVPGVPLPHPGRRTWLLTRLMEADGISYDDLCRGVVAAFGGDEPKTRWQASRLGVREVRLLLWDGLATTEPPDGSAWPPPSPRTDRPGSLPRAGGCSTR